MKKFGLLKCAAILMLGSGLNSFGAACTKIYSSYTMTAHKAGCFEIVGSNLTFDGNGYSVNGNTVNESNTIIKVTGQNVTVQDVFIDCKTKTYGAFFKNAGTSNLRNIQVRNCFVGVENDNSKLVITGKQMEGSNMPNNYYDVRNIYASYDTYTYTYDLEAHNIPAREGRGVQIYYSQFYDYKGNIYGKDIGILGIGNKNLFYLNGTSLTYTNMYDLYVTNVPAVYLNNTSIENIRKYKSNIYEL